jgi:phosphoribosylformimino-5-aminoimidazole carboxamide ribotide isomerase
MAGSASTFDLLPAIDLRGGRVVRLEQGAFDRERIYADDPVAVSRAFAADGARWIHVVDLDGARSGTRADNGTLEAIVRVATDARDGGHGARIQAAGGIRDEAAVQRVLETGAARVVLGTSALTDPGVVATVIERHGPAAIAVALDVRDGRAVGDGWVSGAGGPTVSDAIERLAGAGVETFVVTAIARDGLLGGPDLELLGRVRAATTAAVIASGGIATVRDLVAVRDLGCSGVIVGRALYDGRFTLTEALAALGTG